MGKYKFSLNPKIKGYIEWQLEHYREEKKQLEEYKLSMMPSVTQGCSLTGGIQSGTSNPTEQAALRMATSPYILSTERSIRAIEAALSKCDETDIKLIDIVYWRRTHTIGGAGMRVGLSQSGAYKRINKILTEIACAAGLEVGL